MRVLKERRVPKGKRVHVPVNDLPGRNSLTIKPESCILKEEDNEPKDDGGGKAPTTAQEPNAEEAQEVLGTPKSKSSSRPSVKPRRSGKNSIKSKQ
jgi:hypothetical protein